MSSKTGIEYVDATWNPWSGCTPVSPGCANCYAKRIATRFGRDFSKVTRAPDKRFEEPLHWKTGKRILTCSTSDFFHPDADKWRYRAWAIIRGTPQHTYLLLTKRPGRIGKHLPHAWRLSGPLNNVWLGVTVENQEMADERIPRLVKIPTPNRFLSIEPLLEPIQMRRHLRQWRSMNIDRRGRYEVRPIYWVVCGGESGPGARPMEADWARSIRDQCREAGVPFFMKQMSKRAPIPKDLQIREYPK